MSISKYRTQHGLMYRARVRMPNGTRASQSFAQLADARAWVHRHKALGMETPDLKYRKTKFEDLCLMFLKQSRAEHAPATYLRYESAIRIHLLPSFSGYWLETINKDQILEFKAQLMGRELSDQMKYFIFSTLKTLLMRAVDWDLLAKNPAASIRSPRTGAPRTVYWDRDEAKRFLQYIHEHRRFPIYYLALQTGMRLGELGGLKWDCVNLLTGNICVRRSYDQKLRQVKETTKTRRDRSIPIGPTLIAFLKELKAQSASEFVLDWKAMGLKDPSHASREFAADCERAGVRVIRFHDLRHTFATEFVSRGGQFFALTKAMGHTTSTMTERYAHATEEYMRSVAGVVDYSDALQPEPSANVISLDAARKQR